MSNDLTKEEQALFRQAMLDVVPLKTLPRTASRTLPPKALRPKESFKKNELGSMPALSDYIASPVLPETILSFCQPRLTDKRFNDLSRGYLPLKASLDLHGLTTEEARQSLIQFIQTYSNQKSGCCVLIVHGKGGAQQGKPPVLKNLVYRWLPQFDEVLALHSACGRDGGTGAVYVLLK